MKQFTSALLNSHSVDAAEFLDDISVSRRADNDRCYQIDGFSAGVSTQPQFSSLENIFSSTLVSSPSWPMMPLPWMPGATWSPTPPAGRMQKSFQSIPNGIHTAARCRITWMAGIFQGSSNQLLPRNHAAALLNHEKVFSRA